VVIFSILWLFKDAVSAIGVIYYKGYKRINWNIGVGSGRT
jgi:hypothetical protein